MRQVLKKDTKKDSHTGRDGGGGTFISRRGDGGTAEPSREACGRRFRGTFGGLGKLGCILGCSEVGTAEPSRAACGRRLRGTLGGLGTLGCMLGSSGMELGTASGKGDDLGAFGFD